MKSIIMPIEEVKKQLETVKTFNEKAETVFNAIHDANDKLVGTIGCLTCEPRCGDTYVGFDITGDGSIWLKYYDSHYDSYCEEYVEVPIELFTFMNPKDISNYWYDLKVKEYEAEQEKQRRAEAARKKLLAAKAREAKKKIKEQEYETYLKLKKKYEGKEG